LIYFVTVLGGKKLNFNGNSFYSRRSMFLEKKTNKIIKMFLESIEKVFKEMKFIKLKFIVFLGQGRSQDFGGGFAQCFIFCITII